jgi:hypothetical protein
VERERRETRGVGNELGLGLGGTAERGARLYIGGEGRPRSTVMRGGRDLTAIMPAPCRPLERAMLVSCSRVGIPAQHGHGGQAVPGTGTGQAGPCRSWVVFKRAVSVPAQRAEPIWTSILVAIDFFCNFNHSSYSKNCASTIYFVCYIF